MIAEIAPDERPSFPDIREDGRKDPYGKHIAGRYPVKYPPIGVIGRVEG